jgi:hypothetical protein
MDTAAQSVVTGPRPRVARYCALLRSMSGAEAHAASSGRHYARSMSWLHPTVPARRWSKRGVAGGSAAGVDGPMNRSERDSPRPPLWRVTAELVPSAGFEPTTYRLGGDCSILLSYEGDRGLVASRRQSVRARHPIATGLSLLSALTCKRLPTRIGTSEHQPRGTSASPAQNERRAVRAIERPNVVEDTFTAASPACAAVYKTGEGRTTDGGHWRCRVGHARSRSGGCARTHQARMSRTAVRVRPFASSRSAPASAQSRGASGEGSSAPNRLASNALSSASWRDSSSSRYPASAVFLMLRGTARLHCGTDCATMPRAAFRSLLRGTPRSWARDDDHGSAVAGLDGPWDRRVQGCGRRGR